MKRIFLFILVILSCVACEQAYIPESPKYQTSLDVTNIQSRSDYKDDYWQYEVRVDAAFHSNHPNYTKAEIQIRQDTTGEDLCREPLTNSNQQIWFNSKVKNNEADRYFYARAITSNEAGQIYSPWQYYSFQKSLYCELTVKGGSGGIYCTFNIKNTGGSKIKRLWVDYEYAGSRKTYNHYNSETGVAVSNGQAISFFISTKAGRYRIYYGITTEIDTYYLLSATGANVE